MFRILLFLSIYSARFFPTNELILPGNNESLLLSNASLSNGSNSTIQFNTKSSYYTIYQSSKIIALAYYTYNSFLASDNTNVISIFQNFGSSSIYNEPTRYLFGHNESVTALKALERGLASGSADGMIFIWSNNWSFNFSIQAYSANIAILSLCEISRDLLLSGSEDTSVDLWDLANRGTLVRQYQGHTGGVNALASLGNGNFASGSSDSSVKIWNTNSGQLVMTLIGHTSSVNALAVLNDVFLVSGSSDKTIKIWNITSGALKETLIEHDAPVMSLETLKPYSRNIFSCSSDGTVKKWYFDNYGNTTQADAFTFSNNFACSSLVYMGNDILIAGFRFNDVPDVSIFYSGSILAWNLRNNIKDPYDDDSSNDVVGIILGTISVIIFMCCICGCCYNQCKKSSSTSPSSTATRPAPPPEPEWVYALVKVKVSP